MGTAGYIPCSEVIRLAGGPQWTSTHQRTIIHWMPTITQLWMNLNWVNIWFLLGNQFCSK
jgi:hypothetical protein